jgi:hypothetical protein
MKTVFAPGCALMIYKPYLADKIHDFLNLHMGNMDRVTTCCRWDPSDGEPVRVINICPGCDKRYRNNYPGVTTISLWEILAESGSFEFPDYKEQKVSIIDACPTRDQEQIHEAIRVLLAKMNIDLVEPEKTGTRGTCCGDTFYGELPVEKVKAQMVRRTAEMPVNDVAVYCVSCTKSVFIGGKQPRYLVDLLFNEETVPKTLEPDEWHRELNEYIDNQASPGSRQ